MTGRSTRGRRRQPNGRAATLLLVVAVACTVGIHFALAGADPERAVVMRYVRAWSHDDYREMYSLLGAPSRRRVTLRTFEMRLRGYRATATTESLQLSRVLSVGSRVALVRVRVGTRLFGKLSEVLRVPLADAGGRYRVRYGSTLLFPGLAPGEQLRRRSFLGPRGSILAANGTPLAEGAGLRSPLPASITGQIVGSLGRVPAQLRAEYAAAGYPPNAEVGLDGLELNFQSELAGRPGATLTAGARVLARAPVRPGLTVRTTIVPSVEAAAVSAIAGHYAGMSVLDPRTGAILALVGLAYSPLQPPGSTMKIITATAVLQAGLAKLSTVFPVQSAARIDGYELQNAGGEACGGTLLNAFAVSCNSVFAPLGARLGAARLVATAERFGFNQPPGIQGALESTIPSAGVIGDALAVGSSAIGQGQVQATTLEMADVGAAIADGGRRPVPTLIYGSRPRFVQVTTPAVAAEVQQMMVAVVRFGTGTTAQIPGVEVAGKTGTAEVSDTGTQVNAAKDTDGWFVGYAPVGDPKVVACALYPSAGYGEQTAAPAVAQVLKATLAGEH